MVSSCDIKVEWEPVADDNLSLRLGTQKLELICVWRGMNAWILFVSVPKLPKVVLDGVAFILVG